MELSSDVTVLRDLAKQYMELAGEQIMEQRRNLWRDHLSLRKTPPPVLTTFGMWNVWCREVFSESSIRCQDPFFREVERNLRLELFHASVGDDWILEPWITIPAIRERGINNLWGPSTHNVHPDGEGGSWKFDPVIKEWSDVAKLSWPPHRIDESATAEQASRLTHAIGDIVPVDVERTPRAIGYMADISYWVTQLRGMQQLMVDMYESPQELHKLLAYLRDGVLANQQAAEDAGDFSATSNRNQCFPYSDQTLRPAPNQLGVGRKQLWAFMAAQEYTLISPAMHDEFLLQYQLPILKKYALAAYGCCEDLTRKIDMLRQVPNLRIIAVTPVADVRRCAEQIGTDYVNSWRPNPTDTVSAKFDEDRNRRIIREGLDACKGGIMHLHMKDVETLQGENNRLARWVAIVREEIDRNWR